MEYPYADGERVFVKECPHCGSDLTEVGVSGDQVIDFTAFPRGEELTYEDSWESKNFEYSGAIIMCRRCWKELGRSGVLRDSQQFAEAALEFLENLRSKYEEEGYTGDSESDDSEQYVAEFMVKFADHFGIPEEFRPGQEEE